MISTVGLYQLGTLTFFVLSIGVLAWSHRLPERIRPFGYAATAFCAIMTLGYALMAHGILTITVDGGEQTAFGRFVGYFFAFSIIYPVMWSVVDGSKPVLGGLLFANTFWIGSTIVAWSSDGTIAAVGSLGIFLAFVLTLTLLFGPLSREAGSVSGERRLLFGKLRNLVALILITYMITGILTDSGAGVLDMFVGVFIGIYTDVILAAGFAGILLRSRTALTQIGIGEVSNDADGNADAEDDAEVAFSEPTT